MRIRIQATNQKAKQIKLKTVAIIAITAAIAVLAYTASEIHNSAIAEQMMRYSIENNCKWQASEYWGFDPVCK